MRRIRILLEALAFALCLVIVVGALGLIVVDRSGLIRDLIAERARIVLGDDADGLEIGSARLHWSDPGLRLTDIRLVDREGLETLEVESLRVRLALFPFGVSSIELDGARITLSRGGLDIIERSRGRGAASEDGAPLAVDWSESRLPELRIADVELAIDSRDLLPVEPEWRSTLCDLSLSSVPRADGRPWINGQIVPRPRPDRRLAPIRFTGSVNPAGEIAIQASSLDLGIEVDALPSFLRERVALVGPWSARADMEASLRFSGLDPIPAWSDLRLRMDGFEAQDEIAETTPRDVVLVANARFDRDGGLDDRLLSIAAEGRGSWRGAPFEAEFAAGRAAPSDTSITGNLRLERVPLDDVTIEMVGDLLGEKLGLEETRGITMRTLAALGLRGHCEILADFARGRIDSDSSPPRTRVTAVAIPREGATLEYLGWPRADKPPIAFPVPLEIDTGQVVVAVDTAADRLVQVGFSELAGRVGDGRAEVSGQLSTPPGSDGGDGARPELRLSILAPELDVDSDVRRGLAGLGLDYDVLQEFDPRGGRVAGRLELEQRTDDPIPLLSLDFDLQNVVGRWDRLQIPVDGLRGEVDLRFSRTVQEIPPEADPPSLKPILRRAFGARVALEGRDPDEARVSVDFGVRDPSVGDDPRAATSSLRGVKITARDVPTNGATRAVVEELDGLGEVLRSVSLEGSVDASVRSVLWGQDVPRSLTIAVEPRSLGVESPTGIAVSQPHGTLQVDLSGVTEKDEPEPRPEESPSEGSPSEEPLRIRSRMRASTAGMRDLYVEADLTTEAADGAPAGALEVVGTGVDPFDPIWIELLEGEPEASADLAALQELDPTGLVDVALVQPFTQEFLPLGPPSVLVGLRRNSLRRDHVEVAELRGEIATDLSTASIPELSGTVAGTPVTLQAVRLLPEERLDDLDRPSRALLDRTLPSALTEYVVTARVDLESARVDSDLVARVTDSESSGDWQILLDADDALLLVALPRSGEPALGVSGLFRPHDLRFTNNFRLSSAELDLQHLIVDGASVRGIGRVDKAFGDASGLVIDNAGATISYVEGRLTLDGLDAGLAGGRIQGQQIRVDGRSTGARAASFELMPPYRFDLALQFSGIDVNAVLSEVLSSNSADAGLLRGNLQLIGQPDDPLGLEGTGFLALDDARLYSIPVVRALFKQLGFDASATFDWMRTSIEIRDGELRMTDAVARSPLLRLVGGGTLGLDGRLEHDFDLTYSLVDKLFVLNQLIYWLQSNLLRIAVRGDMTRPRVILTNPVLDLFGRSRQMPPRLPFPRRQDLPARF